MVRALAALVLSALIPTVASAIVRLEITSSGIDPNDHSRVSVFLRTDGEVVGGVQNDILFDTRAIRLAGDASCTIGDAISDRDPNCDLDPENITSPCKALSRRLASCGDSPPADGCPETNSDISSFRR